MLGAAAAAGVRPRATTSLPIAVQRSATAVGNRSALGSLGLARRGNASGVVGSEPGGFENVERMTLGSSARAVTNLQALAGVQRVIHLVEPANWVHSTRQVEALGSLAGDKPLRLVLKVQRATLPFAGAQAGQPKAVESRLGQTDEARGVDLEVVVAIAPRRLEPVSRVTQIVVGRVEIPTAGLQKLFPYVLAGDDLRELVDLFALRIEMTVMGRADAHAVEYAFIRPVVAVVVLDAIVQTVAVTVGPRGAAARSAASAFARDPRAPARFRDFAAARLKIAIEGTPTAVAHLPAFDADFGTGLRHATVG